MHGDGHEKSGGHKASGKPRRVSVKERPSIQLSQGARRQVGMELAPRPPAQLGPWLATALCGNDITSSCLYVAAITTAYAGVLSPLVLLLVAGVLYLYRSVYAEVGDALPLNGGAYNCLLNATTKYKASIAACMTILSYIATAVISGKTAMEYANTLVAGIPVVTATCLLLAAFALLTILGIGESARVALVIFLFHLVVLTVFVVLGGLLVLSDPGRLMENFALPQPHSFLIALFFGFSAAMLGVSGFESSANFIEEQADGVFVKTLRNMWVIVSVFNPLIAAICLGVLPMGPIAQAQDYLLADAGLAIGGGWLQKVVAVDAVLVLSGAVLTSFVGVTGLVRRMALDRCLPQFLLKTNRRKTQHRIILSFLVLCVSIVLVTRGSLLALAGVYTISFLCVMSLFAVGNILLKVRRAKLPRNYRAGWITVFVALTATLLGIVGNAIMSPKNVGFFLTYFGPTVLIVTLMLFRHHLLRFTLTVANDIVARIRAFNRRLNDRLSHQLAAIESHGVIFFSKGDSVSTLNQAVLYVLKNEITKHLTVVHVYQDPATVPPQLQDDLDTLDEIYPEIRIELILRQGVFTPELVRDISREFDIPENYMFIGAPGAGFPHRIASLGGVRVII